MGWEYAPLLILNLAFFQIFVPFYFSPSILNFCAGTSSFVFPSDILKEAVLVTNKRQQLITFIAPKCCPYTCSPYICIYYSVLHVIALVLYSSCAHAFIHSHSQHLTLLYICKLSSTNYCTQSDTLSLTNTHHPIITHTFSQ